MNEPKTVTLDEIMAWDPCEEYPRERVAKLMGGKQSVTALEMLKWRIPAKDRLWGVLRNDFFTDAQLWELACQFAEDALKRERKAGREPDTRSWAAIEARRKWLREEINDEELEAACSAAYSAAYSAACSAAYSAARLAARSAADSAYSAAVSAARLAARWAADSAYSAAVEAARLAARSAACSAAYLAARLAARSAADSQLRHVRQMLGGVRTRRPEEEMKPSDECVSSEPKTLAELLGPNPTLEQMRKALGRECWFVDDDIPHKVQGFCIRYWRRNTLGVLFGGAEIAYGRCYLTEAAARDALKGVE